MKKFHLLLFFIVVVFTGCPRRPAVREGFDMARYEKIGVMEFKSYGSHWESGSAVTDEFVRKFLGMGYDVVVVQRPSRESEQDYRALADAYDVDAIIAGTVTRYEPDTKDRVYFRDEDGKVISEAFIQDARVGISARLIDGNTGRVMWAHNHSYSGFEIDYAVRVVVDMLVRRMY